ncbi:zinc finger protein 385B isoform X1 [Tachysurus ichikawai]
MLIPSLTEKSQAEAHYRGSKHAKKLKAQESTKIKQKGGAGSDNSSKLISTLAVSGPAPAPAPALAPTPAPSPAPISTAMVTDSTIDQSG